MPNDHVPFFSERSMKDESQACTGCAVKEHMVTRRDFVSIATMSAVTLALTACGGAADDSTGPGSGGTGTFVVKPADFPALNVVGGAAKVRNSPPVALAKTSNGLIAFSLACTHQGTNVVIDSDYTMFCPNHGAMFSATGVWTGGQRTSNLVRLPVALDTSGMATITLG
jgi:cytochrome b6-f complex iron-sulfur subunit